MDDHTEPTTDALARAAQALAVTVSIGEALARLHAQRTHERAAAADRAAAAAGTEQALHREQARLVWAPTLDDRHLVRMAATELLHARDHARGYQHADPTARVAVDRIEQRLRDVHPEAMALYDTAIRDGLGADHALRQALPHFRGEFGLDPADTPLHYRLADGADHSAETANRAGDPTTPHVDEATTGQRQAAQLTAGSAAERARALTVLAFPVAMPEAMATAPKAAKAMLALPAPPVRRQLTATPTLTRQ